jgi:hypothetical protein
MKVATISMDEETYEVTVEFSKSFEREEDWRLKADALREAMEHIFEEYDTVLRRQVQD